MYTSKEKIQNFLLTDIDDSLDSQLELWITAAENFINYYTGRKDGFNVNTAETRYYDGNDKRVIDIDDFVSLSSVEYLEADSGDVEWTLTEGLESDYITYPYNDTPKYRLELVSSAQIGLFYSGIKRLKVTGIFGHKSSVPADIELAATMLVSDIVKQGRDGGIPTSENLGDYSTSFEGFNGDKMTMNNVKQILNRYKILTVWD